MSSLFVEYFIGRVTIALVRFLHTLRRFIAFTYSGSDLYGREPCTTYRVDNKNSNILLNAFLHFDCEDVLEYLMDYM